MHIRAHIQQSIIMFRLETAILCTEMAVVPHEEIFTVELRCLICFIGKTAGHEELMRRPLCLPREIECIGKPPACAFQHLMIDGVGEILLPQHLCLMRQLLNQVGQQRNLIVQTELQRGKSCLHHARTRMPRLNTQHLAGKLLCLINASTVKRDLGIDRHCVDIPRHKAIHLFGTGTHPL